MESINLEMGDIFDDGRGGEDEDFGQLPATLPDLDDGEGPMVSGGGDDNGEQNEGDEGDVIANLQRLSKGAAKKRIMKPQPKLDAQRLKTERGLPMLLTMFDGMKFKGNGHEASDLKTMMSKLEHWGHRLFPKMPFEEFTERLEKLGSQKPVKTLLTKIRLDIPILDADVVQQFDNDEDVAEGAAAPEATQHPEVGEMDAEEAYEEMVRMEREQQKREAGGGSPRGQTPSGQGLIRGSGEAGGGSPRGQTPSSQGLIRGSGEAGGGSPRGQTPSSQGLTRGSGEAGTTSTPTASQPSQNVTPNKGMSEDQKERMERNKRKALEKRAARLGVPVSTLLPTMTQTSQSPASESKPQSTQNSAGTATQSVKTPSNTQATPRKLGMTPSESNSSQSSPGKLGIKPSQTTNSTPRKPGTSTSKSTEELSKSPPRATTPTGSVSQSLRTTLSTGGTENTTANSDTNKATKVSSVVSKQVNSSEGNENDCLMETEELLNILEESDEDNVPVSDESKKKGGSEKEYSAPPENTEALMEQENVVSNDVGKTRLASAESDMETESYGLHLTLDTTGSDEDNKTRPATDCDKENSINISNVDSTANNNDLDGKMDEIVSQDSVIF